MNVRRALATFAVLSFLSGCASVAPDQARNRVTELANSRTGLAIPPGGLGTASAGSERIAVLLKGPVGAEAAVEIALLHSPEIRARLAELDVADAERAQAVRLANPSFAFSNKRNAEVRSIERTIMVNVLALITMPLVERVALRQFEDAQIATASAAVDLASRTRRGWIAAVASQESVRYFEDVQLAAEAASELARRMQAVGNFSALARMREHAFAADAAAQLARARQRALADREALTRLMGLADAQAGYSLPDRLPALPDATLAHADLENVALAERLDVRGARRAVEAQDESLELLRATRFVNVLHAGYVNESETGESRKNGYEIEVEVPLFDWGDAKLARAEAARRASAARLAKTELAAASEVREQYAAYRSAFEIARHYRDEIVPLRKRIGDEMLLRYNGMLIGVFELLADAREQVASVNAAIEAARDFWLAEARLTQALTGGSPGGGPGPSPAAMSAGSRATRH